MCCRHLGFVTKKLIYDIYTDYIGYLELKTYV